MPEIELYQEDYTEVGWAILCEKLSISRKVSVITIKVAEVQYAGTKIEYK